MRIGIFGGTFDPPHLGHLILAEECRQQLQLDRLLWVLTPQPPHKRNKSITPVELRLKLVLAAIQDNPYFELSRVDLDRPAPLYSADTVRILRAQNPEAQLVFLVGGDSLRDLPKWHDPAGLIAAVDEFGVMRRPNDEVDLPALERRLPGLTAKLRFVNTPQLEISSTQIRQAVGAGASVRYYLPSLVYNLIETYGLYRTRS